MATLQSCSISPLPQLTTLFVAVWESTQSWLRHTTTSQLKNACESKISLLKGRAQRNRPSSDAGGEDSTTSSSAASAAAVAASGREQHCRSPTWGLTWATARGELPLGLAPATATAPALAPAVLPAADLGKTVSRFSLSYV